eukprot:1519339-Prymnesium_polylepis.2
MSMPAASVATLAIVVADAITLALVRLTEPSPVEPLDSNMRPTARWNWAYADQSMTGGERGGAGGDR